MMEIAQTYNPELDKVWNNGYDAGIRKALTYIALSQCRTVEELIKIIEGELNEEF